MNIWNAALQHYKSNTKPYVSKISQSGGSTDILLQKFKHWSTGLNIKTEGNFGPLISAQGFGTNSAYIYHSEKTK